MRSQTESGNEGQKSLRKAFGEVFNAYHERHFSLVTDEVGNEGYFLALPEKICNLVLSMAEFNWLHLTDLHFSARNQSNLWPNIRESFFQDLTTLHAKTGPWQAILFTGDLVKSGLKEEFDQLNERVLLPLRNHLLELGSQKPVLLAVAGNHDLFRPDDKKPKAALKQLYKTQEFSEFAEEFWTDKDCEYREIVANAFKEFDYWIDNNPFSGESKFDKGLLAGDFTSSLKIEGKNGLMKTIGIAGINTTFLQLKGGDYKGRLAWDMAQLQHACKEDLPSWCRSHDACILMSHQGPEWLNEHSNVEVYPEINPAGRFALHLFGHMHESVLRTSAVGGGLNLRQWQGSSLFSTEKIEGNAIERRHGYSVGQIKFEIDTATIKQWPRHAVKDANGWRFVPDHKSCLLVNGEDCTNPERVSSDLRNTAPFQLDFGKNRKSSILKKSNNSKEKWPAECDELREYCAAVTKTHSHIRFIEVPLQKDLSPVQLDNLYVEPRLCEQEIHPDLQPGKWPKSIESVEALSKHQTLVVLGDPGSGKSTLISCLAWQLCRAKPAKDNPWVKKFSGCVPIPMILRELRLLTDVTWETLLEAFLKHNIGKLLPGKAFLEELLKDGRAIVLLDGLDEIGNLTVRKKLRDAVHVGIATFPNCRWILTSRIIGYDAVPFHIRTDESSLNQDLGMELFVSKRGSKAVRSKAADVLYLAPFNDLQIKSFAKNWYSQHEPNNVLATQSTQDFIDAIAENDGTQRLARIPYLLTLMALIHQKNARLPHGRTELYERIATAYLEQIDLRRHLDQLPYSLAQKSDG